MANTFLTPSVIARESLIVLENNLIAANLVHRDYSASPPSSRPRTLPAPSSGRTPPRGA